jgi:hypothetical protein
MSSSPTVWHNSLAKTKSNLHQILQRETKLFYAHPPFENLYQESLCILYFFFHSPTRLGHADGNRDRRAYIYACGGEFCEVFIFAKLVCQIVGGQFLLFYQN